MKEEIGSVISQKDGSVRVQLNRKDVCTGCKVCIFGADGYMTTVATDTLGASFGDRVKIGIQAPGQVKSAFILYILPLILFIPGYLLGARMVASFSSSNPDIGGFIGGMIFLAVTYFSIYLLGSLQQKRHPRIQVLQILAKYQINSPVGK